MFSLGIRYYTLELGNVRLLFAKDNDDLERALITIGSEHTSWPYMSSHGRTANVGPLGTRPLNFNADGETRLEMTWRFRK